MGVLIVAGMVVVVVTIVNRLADRSGQPAVFGARSIAVPVGARVVSVSVDAGRMYLMTESASGAISIQVVDAGTGEQLGTIRVEAGKK